MLFVYMFSVSRFNICIRLILYPYVAGSNGFLQNYSLRTLVSLSNVFKLNSFQIDLISVFFYIHLIITSKFEYKTYL